MQALRRLAGGAPLHVRKVSSIGMNSALQLAAGLVFCAALADAAQSDVRRLRIPDRDSLILLAAFAVWAMASGLGWLGIALHCGTAVAVFAAGAALFALGVWGGGDVKLLAAMAAWTGPGELLRLLLVMALAGGVLALAVLLARRLPALNTDAAGWRRPACLAEGHVPYGVAIAAAGLDWWLRMG
jgi:prepilin peptidase CpaA